ncbi:MAG: DinB family protein [Ktedonobacterales bacterium]
MDATTALREQLASTHWLLEQCVEGLTPKQLWWIPPGTANTVADNYLHVILNEDDIVHEVLQAQPPLSTSTWAEKVGLSGTPGLHGAGVHRSEEWARWIRSVRVDWATFRQYAQAVHAASDSYLADLGAQELDRQIDLSSFRLNVQSLNFALYNLVIGHAATHVGEIAAIKGCQGLTGHPF